MMDTRPAALIGAGIGCAAVLGLVATAAVSLSDNGPSGPALFNNTDVPMTVTVDGLPHAPVAPHSTLQAPPGTTWVVPTGQSCTWHTGKAGDPTLITGRSTLPVKDYVTVEVC